MEKNYYKNKIYQNIITLAQLADAINKLRLTHESLYKNKTEVREFIEKQLPFQIVEHLQNLAENQHMNLEDAQSMQILIDSIRKELEATASVEVKIAFTPSYKTVVKIATLLREWTKKPLVVAIIIDEQIIAGAQIGHEGTFGDYSLNRWFQTKGIQFIEKTIQ